MNASDWSLTPTAVAVRRRAGSRRPAETVRRTIWRNPLDPPADEALYTRLTTRGEAASWPSADLWTLAELAFRTGRFAIALDAWQRWEDGAPRTADRRHARLLGALILARLKRSIESEPLLDASEERCLVALARAEVALAQDRPAAVEPLLRDLPWADLGEDPLTAWWRRYSHVQLGRAWLARGVPDSALTAVLDCPGQLVGLPEGALVADEAYHLEQARDHGTELLQWLLAVCPTGPFAAEARRRLAER